MTPRCVERPPAPVVIKNLSRRPTVGSADESHWTHSDPSPTYTSHPTSVPPSETLPDPDFTVIYSHVVILYVWYPCLDLRIPYTHKHTLIQTHSIVSVWVELLDYFFGF